MKSQLYSHCKMGFIKEEPIFHVYYCIMFSNNQISNCTFIQIFSFNIIEEDHSFIMDSGRL